MSLNDVLLTNDCKVWLVSEQTEHDQVCICAIEAMARIWVIVWIAPKLADVVQHFVLTLSWYRSITQDT